MPLISIITVCYNAADTIERTIASVDAQTFDDYEHFIVDGKSSDATLAIIKSHPDSRRRWISERDGGIYEAMNKVMSMTSVDYLIFLNAGDKLHSPDTLAVIAKAIAENNRPGIVYGQTDIVDNDGCYLRTRHLSAPKELTLRSFADGMLVCHQSFVALRRIAPSYQLKYRFSADYDWCIGCLQHSRCSIGLTDTVFTDYLDEGVTTRNRRASLIERFRIMCFYYGTLPTILRHVKFALRAIKRQMNK